MATIDINYKQLFERYPVLDCSVIVLCSEHITQQEHAKMYDTVGKMGFDREMGRYLLNPVGAAAFAELFNDPEFQIKQLDLKFVLYKDYWNHSKFNDLRQAIYNYKKMTGQDTQPFIDALKKTYKGEYSGMSFQCGNEIEIINFKRK